MNALWSVYGLEVSISVGAALLTAVGIRLRLWARGEQDEDAPMLRQFVAYLLAYLAAFAAVRGLEGTTRYLVMIAAAALAFGARACSMGLSTSPDFHMPKEVPSRRRVSLRTR